MAPASPPRRSSRARGNGNGNGTSSQHSSGSASNSSRGERSTRQASNNTHKSSNKSTTPSASVSSESLDDVYEDSHLLRRRKRGHDDDLERLGNAAASDDDMVSDDLQDEDDAVRCICASEEYPGLPSFSDEHRYAVDAAFYNSIELTEDVTGFFLQCDTCKVWQHGACVGIISTEGSPEEYFCEKCRKDLHKIHTATNGQLYSHYLPIHRPSRNLSVSRATSITKDGNRSPKHNSNTKGTRPSSSAQTSKRRSTMNSRDAAYDEDEQLRRAIEASKEEAIHDMVADTTSRRAKRGRSESEDNVTNVKRQRTSSGSVSPSTEQPDTSSKYDSDDGSNHKNGGKKSRTVLRIQKDKEQEEKQKQQAEEKEKAKQRAEQSTKRKDRAERRRGDEPDVPEEPPKPVEPEAVVEPPPPAIPPPDTPPPPKQIPSGSHKKSATRSHQKKAKGRNQYTKDRDIEREESPEKPVVSRELHKVVEETPISTSPAKAPALDGKSSAKHKPVPAVNPPKMSMHDMKRRAAAYLEFITRTQVELATEVMPWSRGSETNDDEASDKVPEIQVNGNGSSTSTEELRAIVKSMEDKPFKDLNSMEMLDVLTRRLVKWQNQYSD